MKFFADENIVWQSKDKSILLTTHRLREMNKSWMGSSIKSITLEELDSCELRTDKEPSYLRKALIYFLAMNGMVYVLNHYLAKAQLLKMLFDGFHMDASQVMIVFYLSLVIALLYIGLFMNSFTKVFTFYSNKLSISLQLRKMTFDEREHFISTVEETKINRLNSIQKNGENNLNDEKS